MSQICNVIPPPEDMVTHEYYNQSNSKVTVYRIGQHIRVMNLWNVSLNILSGITLDGVDIPFDIVDTPALTWNDGKTGRLRIFTNGTIGGWQVNEYGNPNAIVTSGTLPVFGQVFYVV